MWAWIRRSSRWLVFLFLFVSALERKRFFFFFIIYFGWIIRLVVE